MGNTFIFIGFTKGNTCHDVLIATLDNEVLTKWGLLLKERICSQRSKFFHFRIDPCRQGRQNQVGTVASSESVPIHLNLIPTILEITKYNPHQIRYSLNCSVSDADYSLLFRRKSPLITYVTRTYIFGSNTILYGPAFESYYKSCSFQSLQIVTRSTRSVSGRAFLLHTSQLSIFLSCKHSDEARFILYCRVLVKVFAIATKF